MRAKRESNSLWIAWIRQPGRYTRWDFVNAITNLDRIKTTQLSEDQEFDPALRRDLAALAAEADFPAHRGSVVDYEFSESARLEAESVLRQMLNERVFQTRDEDVR